MYLVVKIINIYFIYLSNFYRRTMSILMTTICIKVLPVSVFLNQSLFWLKLYTFQTMYYVHRLC